MFCGFYLVSNWQIHVQSHQLKNRLICWMCSKLKMNTTWLSSGVFIVDFDHSQHINVVFLLLTLNTYLSVGYESQIIMFWKHKKQCICFVIKVARPISFSDLLLHRIEVNYEQMTILWTCYEHNMNICFIWFIWKDEFQAYYHRFVPFFDLLYHRYLQGI